MVESKCSWQCPEDWSEWSQWLAAGLHARSAVIYGKPRSVVDPDFVWRRTDEWIVFPWSAEPPVTPSVG